MKKNKNIIIVVICLVGVCTYCLIVRNNMNKDSKQVPNNNQNVNVKEQDKRLYVCYGNTYYLRSDGNGCTDKNIDTKNWTSICDLKSRKYIYFNDTQGRGNLYDLVNKKILFTTKDKSSEYVFRVYDKYDYELIGFVYYTNDEGHYYSINKNVSYDNITYIPKDDWESVNGIVITRTREYCSSPTACYGGLYNIEENTKIYDANECDSIKRTLYDNYICTYHKVNDKEYYNELLDSNGKVILSYIASGSDRIIDNVNKDFIISSRYDSKGDTHRLYIENLKKETYGTISEEVLISALKEKIKAININNNLDYERLNEQSNYELYFKIVNNIDNFYTSFVIDKGSKVCSYYDCKSNYIDLNIYEKDKDYVFYPENRTPSVDYLSFYYLDPDDNDIVIQLIFRLNKSTKKYEPINDFDIEVERD